MPSEQALALQVQLFRGDSLHPDSKFGSIHGGYFDLWWCRGCKPLVNGAR